MKLSDSVNPLYLYSAVQDQIKSSFNSSKPKLTLLSDFLNKKAQNELKAALLKSESKEIMIPHKFSFTSFDFEGLFSSKEFMDLIRDVTGTKAKKINVSAMGFKHKNFTLLHDDLDFKERVVFFYVIGSEWKSEWGGQSIFSFGDDREPIIFEPKSNSLAIIKVPSGMRGFVKYVKHFAGNSEFFKIEGTIE